MFSTPESVEPHPYRYVCVHGTQGKPMATGTSDRSSGNSRNNALRRRWHPETKVIEGVLPEENSSARGDGDTQRPPQKALALRVKFLDPGKID